nr:retrovirus-related Pol polyprotein from transposon TNT 1-94 [Tanacetum cinerariifolium]
SLEKICPRLKTKNNHYKGKAVAEANVTKCDDEESDLSHTTSSSKFASETWLLDFACSHHITPHREWFINFEKHEEVVYTTDETPLATHGIGFVRLQNDDGKIVTLKGVPYSLKLKKNLISVGTLESKGFEVRAKDGVMKIISGVLVVIKGIRKINNTYHYKGRTIIGTVVAVSDVIEIQKLVWVYTLKTKNEAFIKWKKMMETPTCRKSKHLRTDNGKEYKNDIFTKFYEDEGIVGHFTIRHTPQQNGAKAVTYACHLVNRLPSTAIDGKTPFEKWYGKPVLDYDSLHVFGSAAYYHVKESKLDPRAKKALFMGITYGIKGYHLWCPETQNTIFSRDVTFNESAMLKKVNVE